MTDLPNVVYVGVAADRWQAGGNDDVARLQHGIGLEINGPLYGYGRLGCIRAVAVAALAPGRRSRIVSAEEFGDMVGDDERRCKRQAIGTGAQTRRVVGFESGSASRAALKIGDLCTGELFNLGGNDAP